MYEYMPPFLAKAMSPPPFGTLGLLQWVHYDLRLPIQGNSGRVTLCDLPAFLFQDPPSAAHRSSDSGLPSDIPHVRLDSPPSFDSIYTGSSLDPPSSEPPAPPSQPPLPPKVLMSSKSVTYATVVFPGGDKGKIASCEPVQDPPNSQTPPSK